MIPELLERFRSARILVLGDAILDEYLTGDCSRLSPEAPVPVLHVNAIRDVMGGAANTAANVAALGGRVQLISLTGDDAAGERLVSLCKDAGVGFLPIRDGRPTLRKARVIGQHQQLVRLDFEDSHAIAPEIERQVVRLFNDRIDDCDLVVISDYDKGLLTRDVCEHVISAAHAHGTQVIVDPRPQHRSFYMHCDYLTPNWKESQGLLGRPEVAATPATIADSGRDLVQALDTNLLLTLGSQGMAFFARDGSENFSVATDAREVFDVSGAGDTVVATFALARAAGASHRQAVALANRAAGVVVGKLGTATVTPGELLDSDPIAGRVLTREQLAWVAAELRAKGKRITTINGSFDLLHAGHLHILREASRQGDVLIVGLNSDASVRGYKGPTRPLIPQAQRAEMLLAVRYVDYVHVFNELVPMAFLEHVRPDVHVNGEEYGEECIEASTVRGLGGRLHVVNRIEGLSTSGLIEKLMVTTPTDVAQNDQRSSALD